ncbi:phospholipase A2 inhibitor gamma subunit B-like [Spea bombifrons]|uniref:phospholipase A2 inhibitor gamma subunit B-like n=1 Tax=Spea bombifrons TaxID=233779 RepID=UPI00234A4699|nr:phospholipase A2 inhibitor gamma subunit B-like [Spea bombifrons]
MDIKVSVNCCKGDLCNEKIPYSLPEDEGQLNGKLCESCFTNNTKAECSSTERMACRGHQNKCLSYAATVYRSDNIVVDYSMKGCISEKGCSIGFDALPGYRKERVFQCSETLDS